MISSAEYEGLKSTSDGTQHQVSDALVEERPLEIVINENALSVTMRTPGYEDDLIRGLLYCEDIFRGDQKAVSLRLERNPEDIIDRMLVTIPQESLGDGYRNSRQLLSVASCGICGRTSFTPRKGKSIAKFPQQLIHDAARFLHECELSMRSEQGLFDRSGGSHAVALFDVQGRLLVVREDIGRHNATDKAVGALLAQSSLPMAKLMMVSGRISYEIVSKCFMAGIPALAAISSPSSLAVDFAKEFGIALFAFTREGRTTRYN